MNTQATETRLYEVFEHHNNHHPAINPEAIIDLVDTIGQVNKIESYLGKVEEFMDFFNQDIKYTPEFPDNNIRLLRLNLILEELYELAESFGAETLTEFKQLLSKKVTEPIKTEKIERNLVESLDAFVDIQYVLSGAIHSLGFGKVFDEAFDEVHNSNMSKACKSIQEAQQTVNYYRETKNVSSKIIQQGQYFFVLREDDDKVLKSINYKTANLKQFISE